MKNYIIRLSLFNIFLYLFLSANAQSRFEREGELPNYDFYLKTNLLSDITTTLNLGLEFPLSNQVSFGMNGEINPFEFRNHRHWKHILVEPELKWWTKQSFAGHFFGFQTNWGYYNVSHLPISDYMYDHRLEGWGVGAGLSYGYRWNFGKTLRWGLEAVVGFGYEYLEYDVFGCEKCALKVDKKTKNYVGPTQLAINLVYGIGKHDDKEAEFNEFNSVNELEELKESVSQEIYEPLFSVSFENIAANQLKDKEDSFKLSFYFDLGNSIFLNEYHHNADAIRELNDGLSMIEKNQTSTILQIKLKGYSCLRGTEIFNRQVSRERANAVKLYFSNSKIKTDKIEIEAIGEDWMSVQQWIQENELANKSRMQAIIAEEKSYYNREWIMKNEAPQSYKQMEIELFSHLRRVDCVVTYLVRARTDDEVLAAYEINPSSLIENEWIQLLQLFQVGSSEYADLLNQMTQQFPLKDELIINAAAVALTKDNLENAAQYLQQVKHHSASYYNNQAIVFFKKNELQSALEYFNKAIEQGSKEALSNIVELNKYKEINKIIY